MGRRQEVERFYSAQDFETDIAVVADTVLDLMDGAHRHPAIARKCAAKLRDAARALNEIAGGEK